MSLFCLVHGSTQSPEGWKLLAAELRRCGHQIISVDLPVDQPDAGADHYAKCVGSALEGREPAIVAAHSASGLFLPLIPSHAAVSRLVFLAAVIPEIGKSMAEQFRSDPEMFHPDWVGKDPTKDHKMALQYLFHDCSPETAEWALSTLRLMFARVAMSEICPLKRWPEVPCSYISCRDDRTINPVWWEHAARERLGSEPIVIAGGHAPHVSRPRELADILCRLSG